MMTNRQPLRTWIPSLTCLALLLVACSPRAVAPVQPVRSSAVNLKAIRAVIVAARPVQLSSAQTSIQFSVNGVLAALHQTVSPPSSASATEFVVQRGDDTPASLVLPASAPGANFSIGERVEIIDGAEPALVPND